MKLKKIAQAVTLVLLAGPALAQTPPAQPAPPAPAPAKPEAKPEKITVTGSSIKRLSDEGSLPLQIISKEEIDQLGLSSVDQIVDLLSVNVAANTNQITNNAVFGSDGDKTLGGANFANLRGIGPTGTLVLLNGRRVSTHGMSGGSVDLNAIPMDAIERVEILKDGASAIYGTDAIGGVINFITRKDYKGLALRANYSTPQDGSAGSRARVSATGGFGDLAQDGFNLMASITIDSNKILRGTDREFSKGYQPDRFLTPDSTSAMHANIIASAGTALTAAGTVVGTTDTTRYTNLNLLAFQGRCEEIPGQVPLAPNITVWNLFGYNQANSRYRCTRDYGRNYMLAAPQEAVNILVKGTKDLGTNTRGTVEIVASRVSNEGEYSPVQISSSVNPIMNLRPDSPYYLNMQQLIGAAQFNPTLPIAYRVNMLNDLGFRIRENVTDNLRVQGILEGVIGKYDYTVGAGYGSSKSTADLINGFPNTRKWVDLLASGRYNPFILPGQRQTPDVIAAFEDMQMRGKIYDGETTVIQGDATVTGSLGSFLGGDVQFAAGFNARKESYEFSGSTNFLCVDFATPATLSTFNNAALTFGCPGNSSSPKLSRRIGAVFGELVVNPHKTLEVTFQIRHDDYEKIGGTTNPKIGIRWQPTESLLFRGSANTGFRAPTAQQVQQGVVVSNLTGQFRDPELCADINNPINASQCARTSTPFASGGNPNLKPEESEQATFGFVFAPMKNMQVFADYWQLKLEDRIRSLSVSEMISNYDIFRANFVRDPATGIVQFIQAGFVNAAGSKTKGVDFGANYSTSGFGGRITTSLTGTKMLSHKEQILENQPFVEFVGKWSNTTIYLPWRLNASVSYRKGAWNTTFSGLYRDRYEDQNRGPTAQGGANYTTFEPFTRMVSSYSTFNVLTTYSGIKGLTLTGGVINLFDREPPFTWHNVDSAAGTGWDPRVADPRGRTITLSATYKF
ncbi:MAG: TonB-dependent receptor [Betaproteobacteria bacterium]|nr:TonB-dependent receptor [Betaproteobacteria bacterium]